MSASGKTTPLSSKDAPLGEQNPRLDLDVAGLLFIAETCAMYATLRADWLQFLMIFYVVSLHSFWGIKLHLAYVVAMLLGISFGSLLCMMDLEGEHAKQAGWVGFAALLSAITKHLSHSKSCTRPSC